MVVSCVCGLLGRVPGAVSVRRARGSVCRVSAQRPEAAAARPELPIRMLNDRLLVQLDADASERRSTAGIVIPATAAVGKRLTWGAVVAVGQHVRQVAVGDRVLFDPDERAEVELEARTYLLLREKDVHAVAEPRGDGQGTGLYL